MNIYAQAVRNGHPVIGAHARLRSSPPESQRPMSRESWPARSIEWAALSIRLGLLLLALVGVSWMSGCATANVPNPHGVAPQTLDPAARGPISGVGIESSDIIAMTDQMMRDMLTNQRLAGWKTPPRVIIDAEYFQNDGTQPINRNVITDRLRVNLNRSAQGRMTFVGRQNAGMVQQERDLKRQGVTDVGTTGLTKAQAGADYRLAGRIATLDARDAKTGLVQRYNQVTFEMVDLESGVIIWNGLYEFQRAAAENVVYR